MKNRLVGILVLLLIAVIGWPLLFEDDIETPVDLTPSLRHSSSSMETFGLDKPKRDLFAEEDIVEAEKALQSGQMKDIKAQPVVEKAASTVEQVDSKPRGSQDSQGAALSWTLQVASLTDEEAADRLVSELQAKGYKSYSRAVDTVKGKRVRIYVGPSLDKEQLLKQQTQIDKAFKLESVMIRFKPG